MILNGNMMSKIKKNKEKIMMILMKSLLLKIFLKWISKFFWIIKIPRPRTKKYNNLRMNNKKKTIKKFNKKSNKKMSIKMVNRLKKKARLAIMFSIKTKI